MERHGTHAISIDGRMIVLEVNGSHNEIDATIVTDSLRDAIESFNGLHFVELIDARNLSGVTPEGFSVIEQYDKWLSRKGLVARAFVASNTVLPLIIRHHLETTNDMNMRDFSGIEEAKLWLLSELERVDGQT